MEPNRQTGGDETRQPTWPVCLAACHAPCACICIFLKNRMNEMSPGLEKDLTFLEFIQFLFFFFISSFIHSFRIPFHETDIIFLLLLNSHYEFQDSLRKDSLHLNISNNLIMLFI